LPEVHNRAHYASAASNKGNYMQYPGILGVIILIADVWAIVNIFQSSAETGNKVLWTVVVFLLPVLGFILWYFLGPRTGRS
jgi:Phospholipase_D-nuclease N-terminal